MDKELARKGWKRGTIVGSALTCWEKPKPRLELASLNLHLTNKTVIDCHGDQIGRPSYQTDVYRLNLHIRYKDSAFISVALFILSFFFIASYVLREDMVKLSAECVVKMKVAFYVLYRTQKMWRKVNWCLCICL